MTYLVCNYRSRCIWPQNQGVTTIMVRAPGFRPSKSSTRACPSLTVDIDHQSVQRHVWIPYFLIVGSSREAVLRLARFGRATIMGLQKGHVVTRFGTSWVSKCVGPEGEATL